MSSDIRDIEPVTGLVMGSAFLLAGLAIVCVALGWIEVDPASVHAPPWVIGVCGGMFAAAGIATLYYAIVNALGGGRSRGRAGPEDFPVVAWLLGLVIMGGMAVVASWIAFGPGERAFTGSAGVGGVTVGGRGGETFGRWVFGFGAALTWLITIWSMMHGLRRLAGRRR